MAELLLVNRADVNAKDKYKYTPMHEAVRRGYEGSATMAELLIGHGADINAKAGWCRETPLHEAVARDNIVLVKFLLANGADVNARLYDGTAALSLAERREHKGIADLLRRYRAVE